MTVLVKSIGIHRRNHTKRREPQPQEQLAPHFAKFQKGKNMDYKDITF